MDSNLLSVAGGLTTGVGTHISSGNTLASVIVQGLVTIALYSILKFSEHQKHKREYEIKKDIEKQVQKRLSEELEKNNPKTRRQQRKEDQN